MMTEPMMFGIVMISPKSKAAISIVKMSVVPLNIYAMLSSMRRSTCCQRIAYTPMIATAPPNHNKYGHDSIVCCAAIFVQIPTHAYNRLIPTNAPISLTLITNPLIH